MVRGPSTGFMCALHEVKFDSAEELRADLKFSTIRTSDDGAELDDETVQDIVHDMVVSMFNDSRNDPTEEQNELDDGTVQDSDPKTPS